MSQIYKAKLDGTGQIHAIVVSNWNELITERLYKGAVEALTSHNVDLKNIEIFYVPGAFEIGPTAKQIALTKKYDAIICLGCVIKGETSHNEYISSQTARLVSQCSYDHSIPVIFGVLTTDTVEQALDRVGLKSGNKGFEVGVSAIQMVNIFKIINSKK